MTELGEEMLHIMADGRFKTGAISFYFSIPLADKCEITAYSLLASVLKRGSIKYPKTSDLNKRLQELYGASFEVGVQKRGDVQVLSFRFEFLAGKYVSRCSARSGGPESRAQSALVQDDGNILREIIKLAKDIIWTERAFNNEYVEQEKVNLEELLASQMNDKKAYAQRRLVEIMCAGEDYAFSEDGYADELPRLSPKVLEMTHKELLKKPLEVFATGDIDEEDVRGLLELEIPEIFDIRESVNAVNRHLGQESDAVTIEKQAITQSKMCMGFSTGITVKDNDFTALTVYNGVLGGGANSLLFNNVREKMSLCYYVGTRVDRFKGIMLLSAGIDNDRFEVARLEIMRQEKRMRDGEFSEEDLQAAKLYIINSMRSMKDSQAAMEEYAFRQVLSGMDEGIEETIGKIERVGRDEVVRVANKVKLETTFLLTSN